MSPGVSRDGSTDPAADEGATVPSDPVAEHHPAPAGEVERRLAQALSRAGSMHGRNDELREAVSDLVTREKAQQRQPEAVRRALRDHVWRGAVFHTEHPAFPALVAHVFRMASEEYDGEE